MFVLGHVTHSLNSVHDLSSPNQAYCNNLHRLLSIPTLPKYTVGSVPGHCFHVRDTFVVLLVLFFSVFFFSSFVLLFFSFANGRHDF